MGMANLAQGNVDAGKPTTASCPCLSADPCQSYQSRELKTGEKQLFS